MQYRESQLPNHYTCVPIKYTDFCIRIFTVCIVLICISVQVLYYNTTGDESVSDRSSDVESTSESSSESDSDFEIDQVRHKQLHVKQNTI